MIRPLQISDFPKVPEQEIPLPRLPQELLQVDIDNQFSLREITMFLLCPFVEIVLKEVLKAISLQLQL